MSRNKTGKPLLMFITACLFAFLHGIMMSMPITTSNYFENIFHLNSSAVLNIYSFYLVASIIMQVPVGLFFAKFGIRRVMLAGALFALVGIILHMFSVTPVMLLISRLISGFGCSTAYLSALYVAMNFFDNRYIVLLIGILETVCTAGSIVAAGPLYALLTHYGWNITGVILIALFLILLLSIYLFIFDLRKNEIQQDKTTGYEILLKVKKILTNKSIILLVCYGFLNWFIIMSFAGYWIRDYMVHIHGYSTGVALMLSNIYWGSFLVGNLVIGTYAHTYKRIKSMTFILAKSSLIIFLILIIPSVYSYYTIIIFCIVAGISSVAVILSFAMIPYVTKENKDKDIISSIVNMAIVTGGVVGQYSFGYVVFHSHVQKIYFHNPLFSNSYYLALWIYVAAAFMAWAVFMKLSKLLVENEHE